MLASLTARLSALVPFAAATTYGMLAVLVALVSFIDFGHSGLFELGLLPSVALVAAVVHLVVAAVGATRLRAGSHEGTLALQRSVATAVATALVGLGPLAAVAVQAGYSALRPDSLALLSPNAAMLAVGALAAATLVGAPAAAVFAYKATRGPREALRAA